MKIIKYIFIFMGLLIFTVSCANFESGDSTDEIPAPPKEEILTDVTTDDKDSAAVRDFEYCFSEDELYLNGIRIIDLAGKSKEALLLELGEDYVLEYGYADIADVEGYTYPAYGITIFFNLHTDDNDYIELIYCYDDANINGAGTEMSVAEIQEILGKGEIADTPFYVHFPFILRYAYNSLNVVFSLDEENGYAYEMQIYFRPI